NPVEQIGLRGGFRQDMSRGKNAKTMARALLHTDVHLRGRVFADSHKGEARLHTAPFQSRDPLTGFLMNLFGDGPAVDEVIGRHQRTSFSIWTSITGVFGQRGSTPSSPVTMTLR